MECNKSAKLIEIGSIPTTSSKFSYFTYNHNIYNKVSCDNTSNFIYMDMNGFMPERYYRLEFKIVDGFTEQYIDDQIYFKVVR